LINHILFTRTRILCCRSSSAATESANILDRLDVQLLAPSPGDTGECVRACSGVCCAAAAGRLFCLGY
jgi:hypothetical protein